MIIEIGMYYAPGSHRAKLCVAGAKRMFEYCRVNNIPHQRVGKLIVATTPIEVARLETIFERGRINRVPDIEMIAGHDIKQLEPNVTGLQAILSPNTGIVSFQAVAHSYAREFQGYGGHIRTNFKGVHLVDHLLATQS
jgi:L-2-hydroxyglutarate oxidase LhgO